MAVDSSNSPKQTNAMNSSIEVFFRLKLRPQFDLNFKKKKGKDKSEIIFCRLAIQMLCIKKLFEAYHFNCILHRRIKAYLPRSAFAMTDSRNPTFYINSFHMRHIFYDFFFYVSKAKESDKCYMNN